MIEIYFDGACEPVNPGGTASYGWLIKKDKKIIAKDAKIVGSGQGMTNNVAEYNGLIAAIKKLNNLEAKGELKGHKIKIFGDSNLVVSMVKKEWGWNRKKTVWNPHKDAPHLRELLVKALKLLERYAYDISFVPREKNKEADELSKKVLTDAGVAIR